MPAPNPCEVDRAAPRASRNAVAFARCCRGAEALEFAFAFPVLLVMLYGIFEFGRFLWIQNTLEYAVEEAARSAIVGGTTSSSTISAVVESKIVGLKTSDISVSVSVETSGGTPTFVTITVVYVYSPLVDLFDVSGLTMVDITRKTRMPYFL